MPGPGDVNVVDVITLVAFVILVLAVARISRAISIDLIGVPLITWAEKKYGRTSKMYKLLDCYWCNSFWVSLLVCAAALLIPTLYEHNAWILALLPFLWPAVAYGASVVIDKTKVNDGAA